MIYQTAILASLATLSLADITAESPQELKSLFDTFKANYGKSYATEEEEVSRYQTFVDNLKIIRERNAADTAEHGITKFADLSEREFASTFLTLDVSKKSDNCTMVEVPPYEGVESSVDWTGKYTTAVKDQGYCGSCWAFSAAEQIESDTMRTLGTKYTLSEEQIVDCDNRDSGCNGGWPHNAYNYVQNTGGLEQESAYPYVAGNGHSTSCHSDSNQYKVTVTNYHTVSGESSMANHVLSTGPLSIVVDASTWSSYKGGIMSTCGKSINHAVQAVGVDTSSYWKVRNSWGSSWGESGFIRLAYGKNTCGLTYDSTYVDVKLV